MSITADPFVSALYRRMARRKAVKAVRPLSDIERWCAAEQAKRKAAGRQPIVAQVVQDLEARLEELNRLIDARNRARQP